MQRHQFGQESLTPPPSSYKRSKGHTTARKPVNYPDIALIFPISNTKFLTQIFEDFLGLPFFTFRLQNSIGTQRPYRTYYRKAYQNSKSMKMRGPPPKSSYLCQEFCVRNGKNKGNVWIISRFSCGGMRGVA